MAGWISQQREAACDARAATGAEIHLNQRFVDRL
jgi:hypothetical protein